MFGAFDLQYEVDSTGRPQNATVVDSSGSPAMAEAALESVARYRYLPRVVDGEPVIVEDATMMIMFAPSN
ncbi:MAG: energy transducer TonB [Gammaproteobacteria bacterium]